MRMGRTEWLMLLGLAGLWGGSFLFLKIAVQGLPPLVVVLGRVGLAAPVLLICTLAMGHKLPRSPRRWSELLVMGLLNNALPFTLFTWSQTRIDSGVAAILNATTPVW